MGQTSTPTSEIEAQFWYGRLPAATTCPSGPFADPGDADTARSTTTSLLGALNGSPPSPTTAWDSLDPSLQSVFGDFDTFDQSLRMHSVPESYRTWQVEMVKHRPGLPTRIGDWLRANCTQMQAQELDGAWIAVDVLFPSATGLSGGSAELLFLARPEGLRLWVVL